MITSTESINVRAVTESVIVCNLNGVDQGS